MNTIIKPTIYLFLVVFLTTCGEDDKVTEPEPDPGPDPEPVVTLFEASLSLVEVPNLLGNPLLGRLID